MIATATDTDASTAATADTDAATTAARLSCSHCRRRPTADGSRAGELATAAAAAAAAREATAATATAVCSQCSRLSGWCRRQRRTSHAAAATVSCSLRHCRWTLVVGRWSVAE